jgi:hypothetical protein
MLFAGSCVAVLPSWHTISLARHTGSFCWSYAKIVVVVRGGSRRSVAWGSHAPCGLSYRHEPASLVGMHRHTPGMVYLSRTTRYSGHRRISDAEVLQE